jgi:hypothetical protein
VNTVDALARLAGFGLPGIDTSVVTLDHPDELLTAAEAGRALPWVAASVEAGEVHGVSDSWRSDLRRRQLGAVQTTMAAHAAATSVVSRLASAGVSDVRVLKGCASGQLDYVRAVDRFSTDVDLLVQRDDLATVLEQFLVTAVPAPRRDYWQYHYGKSTTVLTETFVQIDIHTMLGQGYFGSVIPVDELMDSPVSFSIGDTPMSALDGPNRLIHAANHVAASHHKGLHSIRDVLQLVLVSDVDWAEAIVRVQRWKADALFARGVVEAWGAFALPSHPLLEWAQRQAPHGRQRLAFGLVGERPRGHLLTAPLALPPHRWPGYVLPLVFPSRAYLAENRKGWGSRAKAMLTEVLPGRR